MAKTSMRFDKFLYVQENKPKKIKIESVDNWVNVGKIRKCYFKIDTGVEYNTQFADKVLLTATARINPDSTITEEMRVVLIVKGNNETFKILSVMPSILNGRKVTQLKLQRWAFL